MRHLRKFGRLILQYGRYNFQKMFRPFTWFCKINNPIRDAVRDFKRNGNEGRMNVISAFQRQQDIIIFFTVVKYFNIVIAGGASARAIACTAASAVLKLKNDILK